MTLPEKSSEADFIAQAPQRLPWLLLYSDLCMRLLMQTFLQILVGQENYLQEQMW